MKRPATPITGSGGPRCFQFTNNSRSPHRFNHGKEKNTVTRTQYALLTEQNQADSSLSERRSNQARSRKPLTPEISLHDLLTAVLGQRDVVVVGTWVDDARGFEPEPIYLVRSSVIDKALNDEQDWGLVYERFSAGINIVPGTVLAASVTVLA